MVRSPEEPKFWRLKIVKLKMGFAMPDSQFEVICENTVLFSIEDIN